MNTLTDPNFQILILTCHDDYKLAVRFRNDLLGILTLGYGHAVTMPDPVYLEHHIHVLGKKLSEASIVLFFYSSNASYVLYEKRGLQEELESLSAQKHVYWVEARTSDTTHSGISFLVPELGALSSLKPVARDRMVLDIAKQLAQDIDNLLIARGLPLPSAQTPPIVSLGIPLDMQTCTYCGNKQIEETCPQCGHELKQASKKTAVIIGPDSTDDKDRVNSIAMHFHEHARVKALGVSGFLHRNKLEPLCKNADLIVFLVSSNLLSDALEGNPYQGVCATRTLLLENPDLQRKCVLVYLRPCLTSHFLPDTKWEFTTIAAEYSNLDAYGAALSQALQRL